MKFFLLRLIAIIFAFKRKVICVKTQKIAIKRNKKNFILYNGLNGLLYLSGCIVSIILDLKSLFFIIALPFFYLFVMLVCTKGKGQHSKRLRMKYFWPLTERSLTPYWQYFNYFLGRGGYFLYKITMNLYVRVFVKKMYILQQIFTETSPDSQHTLMDPFRKMGPSYYRMFTAI